MTAPPGGEPEADGGPKRLPLVAWRFFRPRPLGGSRVNSFVTLQTRLATLGTRHVSGGGGGGANECVRDGVSGRVETRTRRQDPLRSCGRRV